MSVLSEEHARESQVFGSAFRAACLHYELLRSCNACTSTDDFAPQTQVLQQKVYKAVPRPCILANASKNTCSTVMSIRACLMHTSQRMPTVKTRMKRLARAGYAGNNPRCAAETDVV